MEVANNRLLVIGGTGFIGRSVVESAVDRDFVVTILSKNPTRKIANVEYIVADIADRQALLGQLKDKHFDYVINLGGYVDHSRYFEGGGSVYTTHFLGVKNLVDCLATSLIKTFVQIGSSDEYGSNPAPQRESQREAPFSMYSFAKVSATHFLQTLHQGEGFPAVILRPFLVYGPGQNAQRFLPQIIQNCLDDSNFPVSRGEQLRDFCFIDDFVRAVFLALDNTNAYGQVINISSGDPTSIKDMVEKVVNLLSGGQPEFGRIPYREGENMSLYADISRANSLLQWKPEITLEQGLKETIDWFQQHNNE